MGKATSKQPAPASFAALVSGIEGLGPDEVAAARRRGAVNRTRVRTSRSLGSIISANTVTRFNAILSVLLVVILVFGSPRDALFGVVMVLNSAIGIIQEWRAKVTLDRLSIVTAARVRVLRNGEPEDVLPEDIVENDAVVLSAGDQVPADGVVLAVQGAEVDESLLTGESAPVPKHRDDRLMSGSVVMAGQVVFQATTVGEAAYAAQMATEARVFHLTRSELQDSINLLLRVITWAMGPVALALFLTERSVSGSSAAAAVATVSGLVGMIPQGLVLLTSMSFAIGVIRLGRHKALVQELPAVETLARVDVVCFDKTGTLTTGRLTLDRIEPVGEGGREADAEAVAGAFARAFTDTRDPMLEAIAGALPDPAWPVSDTIAFSPLRRWSAARFDGHGTWVIGAPEVIAGGAEKEHLRERARDLARTGARLLLLARGDETISAEDPGSFSPVAFVLLREELRADAAETIAYFRAQGVALKVISGDSPLTVAAVVRAAGVSDASDPVDGAALPEDAGALADIMEAHTVFGRIKPQQKKAMVAALQADGHTVAMLGDGVNDVLAIKQADLGLTVGSGAPASKAVAQIVLTDGRFSVLPRVVAEGRLILANIERVAVLFITKTTFASLLILAVTLLSWPFPLLPRHFTLIDAFTIGIPAFILSLGPSNQVFRPGFLRRILRIAVPAGTLVTLAVLGSLAVTRAGLTLESQRTLATAVVCLSGLGVLALVARPLMSWRGLLVLAMAGGVTLAFALPASRAFFALNLAGLWP